MEKEQKQDKPIGADLKEVRGKIGLSQEDMARLLQVTPNTVARWERCELEPGAANKKRVRQLISIAEDDKVATIIRSTLESKGGLPATAALLGMLFGVMSVMGVDFGMVTPIFRSNAQGILLGVRAYLDHAEENEKGGSDWFASDPSLGRKR